MEILAAEDIDIGTDLIPPLSPLASSLYDSFLSSHCSSCFSLLPQAPPHPHYCSAACSLTDSPIDSPQSPPEISPILPSDIRTALRLLNSTVVVTSSSPHRLNGLLTNHHRIMSDPSLSVAIQNAASFIATFLRSNRENTELEEAAICSVLTNAVEVQDSTGLALGIALYDSRFSWINHSCSPNSCYRFVNTITTSYQDGLAFAKTIPHIITNTETSSNFESKAFCSLQEQGRTVGYGPKVIVRSIKKIKDGEEITVSYMDLLQPTGLRQSDLWSKYRFMCNCGRCVASPPAYVDSILEGVLALEPEITTVSHFHGTTNKDEAAGKMSDHIQGAIDDFLSDDINRKTCCEKIESVLHHGIQIKADSSQPHHLRLHPCHHVALNAYITLATAYKIRSVDSEIDMGKAFEMSRISAAYSFFLACASHHLFSAEPSFAISATSFWKNAGESLLDLALKFSMESSVETTYKCTKCLTLETPNSHRDIKEKSRQILSCVTDISQVVWSFLTRGCPYLAKFRSPVDFSFATTNGDREESNEDQMLVPQGN
ncbi:PREDICTED: protein SET DOMAIN GROUP 41-like isoform X1 [Camelina sativa]|uniref:Protein SET DOMAIN GROUP 41-like isoform X1 n=1 Tax=Camelina sativa TaxID=90675 RepID=A0ABM0YFD6_CAMSA|nr:PREDICTED: protein SET DOMAIN GROUP 41-like isoform X1 [Camelina sativa]